jgi:L-ascorbate metabolism protein UlaG (beta-lactamase superfamily)
MTAARHSISMLHIGGATALLEIGGLRIVLDPTFDPPQEYFGHYTEGLAGVVRTEGPALQPHELGKVDVALISHDHHIDNLDYTGRDLLKSVSNAYTTPIGALRLRGQTKGLAAYDSDTLNLPDGGQVTITAVPAHHGPDGIWQAIGPVTGFVLTGSLPPTYWSGDNSDVRLSREIIERFPDIRVAVLNVGGPSFAELGPVTLTFTNEEALEVSNLIPRAVIVPIHNDSWAHFKQDARSLRGVFQAAGVEDRLRIIERGHRETIAE